MPQGSPVTAAAAAPRRPGVTVHLVLHLDLALHVDPDGCLGQAAVTAAFPLLAQVQDEALVALDLGPARWLSNAMVALLGEHLTHARSVTFRGQHPAALKAAERAVTEEAARLESERALKGGES